MYSKEYYQAHREKILATNKKWRKEHAALYKKIQKGSILKNKTKYALKQREYISNNWEDIYAWQKQYYLENRDKIIEKVRTYKKKNIHKIRLYLRKLRLEKKYRHIGGWIVSYENVKGRFYWQAIKGTHRITDEKEDGFPTFYSACRNAMSVLGEGVNLHRSFK